MITAFGEILRPTSSGVSARRSLSGTRSRWGVCAAAKEAGKRTAAAPAPINRRRSLAGVQGLLYICKAAAEEPDNKGIRYAGQSRQKPPQTRIL